MLGYSAISAFKEFCPEEKSMDEQRKKLGILPPPTPIAGLDPDKPLDLLTASKQTALQRDLDEMAKVRRQAEAKSGSLKLG